MPTNRIITAAEAIREATAQAMERDSRVVVIGEGVPDPKGIFGTTSGLRDQFGSDRVFDMPVAENGMTGVVIGAALSGMRPILTHQRIDFALYSLDQIVNNAAKWFSMFGGQVSVPLVIRMVIGRGWGQGAQHSQNLQALFAHIPGLKVVMPSTAYDAKGLLKASIEDNNPVMFLEHRWIHGLTSHVPEEEYSVPLGVAEVVHPGSGVSIVANSYMTIEALHAAKVLEDLGVSAEVVDLRTLAPLDEATILQSVRKTGHALVVDSGWATGGFSGELVTRIAQGAWEALKQAPQRITLPDIPTPSTPALTQHYYSTYTAIVERVASMFGLDQEMVQRSIEKERGAVVTPHDVPNQAFTGPF